MCLIKKVWWVAARGGELLPEVWLMVRQCSQGALLDTGSNTRHGLVLQCNYCKIAAYQSIDNCV